eukprot:GEMP01091286.1.p2 GENE.GEMP01091286.1~~GEMP01091286.1.p2  ORF type:complete len:112 (+),score=7.74 GEMP01091286.1:477-812(+)
MQPDHGYRNNNTVLGYRIGHDLQDNMKVIFENTGIRLTDFDSKSQDILAELEKVNKAISALHALREHFETMPLDNVNNRRGYIYAILRQHDAASYQRLKDRKATQQRPRRQ